jgi:hypothetical protein
VVEMNIWKTFKELILVPLKAVVFAVYDGLTVPPYRAVQNADGTWRIDQGAHTIESPFPSEAAAKKRIEAIEREDRWT